MRVLLKETVGDIIPKLKSKDYLDGRKIGYDVGFEYGYEIGWEKGFEAGRYAIEQELFGDDDK